MSKFVIILLAAGFAACINADDNSDDFFNKVVKSGRGMWDGVMAPMDQVMDMGEKAIKGIKPIANGMASGKFTSSKHYTEIQNDKVVADGGFSKSVTNKDGSVEEISSTE